MHTNHLWPSIYNTTYYSFFQSSISIDELINHALVNQHQCVVICDHHYMYGYMEFYTKAKANHLKPIFALSFSYDHQPLILVAKNLMGYRNLVRITSAQKIELPWLEHLFIIAFTPEHNLDLGPYSDQVYVANAESTQGVYIHHKKFAKAEDYPTYCALIAIASGHKYKLSDVIDQRFSEQNDHLNYQVDLSADDHRVMNLLRILNECEAYDLPTQNQIIDYPITNGWDPDTYLRELVLHGFHNLRVKQLQLNQAAIATYLARIDHELATIKKMKFANYFLIVHDFVNYARSQSILVGPGRGSAAGSLVSYCLGITSIDPIANELYFERFLNPYRNNMPDIDLDFMDTRREEVVHYLYDKYTNDHVAKIIVFQRWKPRGALRDIGRILGINLKLIDQLCKKIPLNYHDQLANFHHPDLEKIKLLHPQLFALADRLLGLPRQIGLHAAGIVLSKEQLGINYPIAFDSQNETHTQYSMEYLEQLGLLKIDLLGLRNLTIIVEIIKLIYQNTQTIIDIEKINFADPHVYADLSSGNTLGIFQLESPGMTNLLKRIQPKSLADLSLVNALYRPGPQKQINHFIAYRNHEKKPRSLHEKLDPILKATYGVIIYQEQLMQVVQAVTQQSAAEADMFRRAISKKDDQLLRDLKTRFLADGLKHGYQLKELTKIWDYIYEFANYGFNKSHSLSYSVVSYQLAWLKCYYPKEFYCVYLDLTGKYGEVISALEQLGLTCQPPSINQSVNFSIVGSVIYLGLKAIKGLGSATINKIAEVKAKYSHGRFQDLASALVHFYKSGISNTIITTLNHAGYFDELFQGEENRQFLDVNLMKIIERHAYLSPDGVPYVLLPYDPVPYFDHDQYLEYEISLLGYGVSSLKAKHVNQADNLLTKIAQQLEELADYFVYIKDVRQAVTKRNMPMAWVVLGDETTVTKAYPYFGKQIDVLINHLHQQTKCRLQLSKKAKNIIIKYVYHEQATS